MVLSTSVVQPNVATFLSISFVVFGIRAILTPTSSIQMKLRFTTDKFDYGDLKLNRGAIIWQSTSLSLRLN